ncbi:MAG: DUF4294 domain-containing protein [Alistipes sp.]|nr:DUF4294 domain-containing protein [Alistipes sp.]
MKRHLAIALLALVAAVCCVESIHAQGKAIIHRGRGYWHQEWSVDKKSGDSIPLIHMMPIYKFNRGIDARRYYRLIRTVKKVYPLAQIARREMADMEDELRRLPTKKEQHEYVKTIEKRIVKQYTPLIKRMTLYEGKILCKLIDRETEFTAYQIIKDFRGGFVAGFWQGLARIFGNNLKLEYEREGEDKMLEQIVIYHEAGLL